MNNFLNDFRLFFSTMMEALTSIFNWFTSNIIGEITLFIVLISLFLGFILFIVHMKD